ncbi:MAG TPA: hypothetical protein VFZ53_05070 [Polyangiaceae bacterium]
MVKNVFLMLGLCLTTGCDPKEEIVLPNGFEGAVVIVYGDPTGIDSAPELRVPRKGIVFVKEPSPKQAVVEVFALDSRGVRRPVPFSTNRSTGDLQYFRDMTIGAGKNRCVPNGWTTPVQFTFVVGVPATRSDWEALQKKAIAEATAQYFSHLKMESTAACFRESSKWM